ncbi:hemolysin family protein [Desulfovibrio cuneatus]|uniref:hemolysin family protein n=1 Tax=Desulfovibrio cuneatus TaxID=159728 RepID=UPI0003F61919|nr:hemolysin family protein [Desulfovibrio cuneatus]
MDEGSGSSIWHAIKKVLLGKGAESVEAAIDEASKEGELDQSERSMLLNVLRLDDMQVQEIMTPRTDIVCASHTDTLHTVMGLILSSGHSRIPLYKETRDDFIGVVHAKDLLRFCLEPESMKQPAHTCMRPVFFVPETKDVVDLLHEFQRQKNHLAIILDEFGGTTGLVSFEDVLEEIVGEIEDEHDAPKQAEIQVKPDGTFDISGRAYLEDINEQLGLSIQSEEVDTIGGYLTHLAGHVPKAEESFTIHSMRFVVKQANTRQVRRILAEPLSAPKALPHA